MHITKPTEKDARILARLLDNPPKPNEALKQAAQRYRQEIATAHKSA